MFVFQFNFSNNFFDNMSLINETLKNITLKELCIVIISLFAIFYILKSFNIVSFDPTLLYVLIIFYFAFKLRNSFSDLMGDVGEIFSREYLQPILLVVVLNIFLSYGFLYLADFIIMTFPSLDFLVDVPLSSLYLNNSINLALGLVGIIVVSPISEELIFRELC